MFVVQATVDHMMRLPAQEAQSYMTHLLSDPDYAAGLIQAGPAYAAIHDGEVIACAGVIPQWEGRLIAWAILGRSARKHMLPLTRQVLEFIGTVPARRIETTVETAFIDGHRWAKILGFKYEGTLRKWSPDGRDFDQYARVQ